MNVYIIHDCMYYYTFLRVVGDPAGWSSTEMWKSDSDDRKVMLYTLNSDTKRGSTSLRPPPAYTIIIIIIRTSVTCMCMCICTY